MAHITKDVVVVVVGVPAEEVEASPLDAPKTTQTDELVGILPSLLQLSISGALKLVVPTGNLAFKMYTGVNLVGFTLDTIVVMYLIRLSISPKKSSAPKWAKLMIWVSLAMSYLTFFLGTLLNILS